MTTFLGMLLGVLAGVMLSLNLLLNRIVIAPIKKMARFVDAASTSQVDEGELNIEGTDEIAVLSSSFNRMNRSLRKAMEMIDE